MLESVDGICGGDESVDAAVEHFTEKCNVRRMNRQKLLDVANEAYENNETAKNLKMGPVSLNFDRLISMAV